MKKIIGIVACLVVAAAIGAYFFVIPEFEKKQVAQVEAFIDQLPGDLKAESTKARFFDDQLEILGLKGTVTDFYGEDIKIDVRRVVLNGVNMTPGQGIVNLVDEAVFEDLKFYGTALTESLFGKSSLKSFDQQEASQELKAMTVKGLRGDYAALHSAVATGSRADVFDCLTSGFSADQISANGYGARLPSLMGPALIAIKSVLIKDAGMLKNGYTAIEGVSVDTVLASVSIGSLTAESCQAPNFYRTLLESLEQGSDARDEPFEIIFDSDAKDAAFVKNMVMKDLKIVMDYPGSAQLEPITFAELNFDFSLSKDDCTFKHGIREMSLPASVYRNLGREFAKVADTYGKPLNMDAMVDFDAHKKDGKGIMTVNRAFIEDKSLGSLSFTFSGDILKSAQGRDKALLTKARFSLEDKGLIDMLVVACAVGIGASPEDINNPAYLRDIAANDFAQGNMGDDVPDSAAKVLAGCGELLKAPGTLTMSYEATSERPFIEDDSLFWKGLPFEDVTVEYVPAKQLK